MKIGFFTEGGYTAKVPRNHPSDTDNDGFNILSQ